ncbi:uncharacterized protein LOC110723359 [Chenopodium quinoa]|uniref:uncharacterized protein LOC110723359 n=1 Tax=Chenopodium quinoa TaxID=63459 RepID=UPI000B77BA76|nr:uncharacterized protein LOC110723359 [Chenopodium quinoa]
MAEDLIAKCANLNIEDEDGETVDCGTIDSSDSDARVSLMLVGKLLTDRGVNIEAFKRTITQSWGMKGKVVIRAIGANFFGFQFFHSRDKEKVLLGRPWCFEQSLLILNEIKGNEQPQDFALTHSPFWIRLENLPFNCRSEEHARVIASKLGEIVEIESDVLGIDKNRRVKVMLDVSRPLRRYINVKNREGSIIKMNLKYERLPFFCFMCRVMGHNEKDCVNVPEDLQHQGLGWGSWLKASPRRGRRAETVEVQELSATRKLSFITKDSLLATLENSKSVGKMVVNVDIGGDGGD